ncbi:MAG TPA: secretin N-terminal domain-containing protein, partial [Verrucomicrobiae bacterium]|nr:secretin N-terminal domain-containing protein [Verrucomicrobiae bacterium]
PPPTQPADPKPAGVEATNVPAPGVATPRADGTNAIPDFRRALQQSATNRAAQSATGNVAIPTLPLPRGRPAAAPPSVVPTPAPTGAVQTADGNTAAGPAAQPGTLPAPPANTTAPSEGTVGVAENGDKPTILLKFNNAPADQIFEEYAKLTSRTVLRAANLAATPVTIFTSTYLTREEAIQALDGALSLNGITMIKQDKKFVKAVPNAQAPMEGAAISKVDPHQLPDAEQFETHIVQLKLIKPSAVQQLLATFSKNPGGIAAIDDSQILVLRDYSSNIKRMVELIGQMDVPPPEPDYRLEVIPIKYGKVTDLFNTMNALITGSAGGTGTTTAQRRPGQLPTGGTPGQFGTGNRVGTGTSSRYGQTRGFNQPGVQPQQQQLTGAQPGATTPGASFQNRLNQILNRAAGESTVEVLGDARIVPDERSNSLIVFANKQDIQMITNIVSKVDVLLAQVLIEGIVMSVTLNDSQAIGVSWLQNPKRFNQDVIGGGGINNGQGFLNNLTNFSSALPSGFSYFGKLGNDVQVSLTALANDGRVRILQRPRLQTSHAVQGTFFSGSTVPYVTGFSDYGFGTGIGTRSQVEQISVGVTLDVVPFITPDGLVVLDIVQDISSIDKFVKIDQNDVPTTVTRNANATLSVRDGDTIMLGGYIEDTKTTGKSGVPVLKDIPLLGALFRSSSKNTSRSELILLLHVTVLRSPAEAGAQATAETAKVPSIFEAEKELKKEDQKRLRKSGSQPLR